VYLKKYIDIYDTPSPHGLTFLLIITTATKRVIFRVSWLDDRIIIMDVKDDQYLKRVGRGSTFNLIQPNPFIRQKEVFYLCPVPHPISPERGGQDIGTGAHMHVSGIPHSYCTG
jgi:hypothetical protein